MSFIDKHFKSRANILKQFKGFLKFFALNIFIVEFSFCFTLITHDCSTLLVIYLITWVGVLLYFSMYFVSAIISKHPEIFEIENLQNNSKNMRALEDCYDQIQDFLKDIKDKTLGMTAEDESSKNKIESRHDTPQIGVDPEDG